MKRNPVAIFVLLILAAAIVAAASSPAMAPQALLAAPVEVDLLAEVRAAQGHLQTAEQELAAARAHLEALLASSTTSTVPPATTTPTTATTLPPTTSTAPPTTSTLPPTTTTTTAPPTTTTAPPTTTTAPPTGCAGISVAAGANLVTVANAQPAGTTFCLAPGTYTLTAAIPDQAGDRWIGALDATGARQSIITGNDGTPYAFAAVGNNVQLRNVIIERFKSPTQRSPFQSNFYLGPPTGWLIDNVESRYNWATGMGIGSQGVVRNSYIHHNRQNGITTNGVTGALIEHNEISFNNYLGLYSPAGATGEAGGSKFLKNTNLILHANNVHDNCGPGLWNDSNNVGTLYEQNMIVNNAGPGIMHEISYEAVIRNNHIEGNAHGTLGPGGPSCLSGFSGFLGGAYISTSRGVEIYGNTFLNNDGGVIAQQENRGTGILGVWESDNLNVHDNTIAFGNTASPWHGFRYVGGPTAVNGMRFEANTYDVPTTGGTWWMWQPAGGGGLKTWAQWQAFGFDDTGSVG